MGYIRNGRVIHSWYINHVFVLWYVANIICMYYWCINRDCDIISVSSALFDSGTFLETNILQEIPVQITQLLNKHRLNTRRKEDCRLWHTLQTAVDRITYKITLYGIWKSNFFCSVNSRARSDRGCLFADYDDYYKKDGNLSSVYILAKSPSNHPWF